MSDSGTQSGSRQRGNLERVDDLLFRVSSRIGLERRLREHTAMSLWAAAADPALCERSRPLFIDLERNIVIAAQNASVAQEISLAKSTILRTLSKMARTVGVEIKGIRIDLKQYYATTQADHTRQERPLPSPSPADLEAVQLDGSQSAWIKALEAEMLTHPQRQPIVAAAVKRLKLINWRKLNGYPCCGHCGLPARRLHEADKLCFTCLMERRYPVPIQNGEPDIGPV